MVILWVCCGYHMVWDAVCPEFGPDLGGVWKGYEKRIVQKLKELFAKVKIISYLCRLICVVVHELNELR